MIEVCLHTLCSVGAVLAIVLGGIFAARRARADGGGEADA